LSSQRSEHRRIPSWFSVEKAHAAQLRASKHVIRRDMLPERINYVAGVDVAYTGRFSIGAVAVLDYQSLSLIESKTAQVTTEFPYVPTLLSFRETPPSIAAIEKLRSQPDVFLVDGQGIMHPYRLGFASHLGITLGKPSVGVAKSPLIGQVREFGGEGWAPIIDAGETVGVTLLTKNNTMPLYVSIGHMVSLVKAIEIVRHCTLNNRVPQPIFHAHTLAAQEKRKTKETLE
jgi:deoxyribonuclease V